MLAVWSRIWIVWFAIFPIAVVCLWVWLNPRIFGVPQSTDNWASRAVLGERVLLLHNKSEIPNHHIKAILVLKIIISIGFVLAVYGIAVFDIELAIFGTVITILGKTWFLDRMVWLFQDLQHKNITYQSWLY